MPALQTPLGWSPAPVQSEQLGPQQVSVSGTQVPLLAWYPGLQPAKVHVPLAALQVPEPFKKKVVQFSDPVGPQFTFVCCAQEDPFG